MVELTKSEAAALEDHLEWYIIQEIRDDADYDNMQRLVDLVHVYEKCNREVANAED